MEWKYVKRLEDESLIDQFAKMVCCSFSPEFLKCVKEHNGGRPSKRCFDTDRGKGRVLKSFLSFNRQDKENVWDMLEWEKEDLGENLLPFAIDPAGNLICLKKTDGAVVFLNHETGGTELAAASFAEFLGKLYE